MGTVDLVLEAPRFEQLLVEAICWAKKATLCLAAPRSAQGSHPVWSALLDEAEKVELFVCSRAQDAEAWLLQRWHERGCLRLLDNADATFAQQLLYFERDGQARVLLTPFSLSPDNVGPGFAPTVYFWGDAGAPFAETARELLARWRNEGRTPDGVDLERHASGAAKPSGRRPLRDQGSFTELGLGEQQRLLWSYLIGQGALTEDRAVELCAQSLRDDEYISYQRLRRDGPLYDMLATLLRNLATQGDSFRYVNDQVQAIQPKIEDYSREDWLECLSRALPDGEALDRASAHRLLFDYAREHWGLAAQRIRSGGKTEKALKSTINSAIRRGLLRRVGAAYVEKATSEEQPTAPVVSVPPASAVHTVPPVSAVLGAAHESATSGTPPTVSLPPVSSTYSASQTSATSPPPLDGTEPESDDLLGIPLTALPLPTRATNWAERQSLSCVRDLVAWHPDAFSQEPNLGRLSVSETRAALEAHLQREWEEAWAELGEPKQHPPGASVDSDEEAHSDTASTTPWNLRLAQLSDDQRSLPLARLDLPARMRNYCEREGMQHVGELFTLRYETLLNEPNLGRGSLRKTLTALDEALHEVAQPPLADNLVEGWLHTLKRLPTMQRLVLSHRSGVHGQRQTLESVGEVLGVTRERVRQLEVQCLEDLKDRSTWVHDLERRLHDALAGGRSVPFPLLLEQDDWWRDADKHPELLDYLLSRLLRQSLYRVDLEIDGKTTTFLATFNPSHLAQVQATLLEEAAAVPTPASLAEYDPIVERAVAALDPPMREALQATLESELNFDEAEPTRVLSFGSRKAARILAYLAGQPAPVPVSQLFEELGRCHLPDEVLYFKRGVVGLEQHFPDFQIWLHRLTPLCIELMQELPAGRQWMVPELHDQLKERHEVPDWLGHWPLASLLRRSGRVAYLGRLRVALPIEGQVQERLQLEDAVRSVLEETATPLSFSQIAERVRERTDAKDASLSLLLLSSPFLKLDTDRYGLVDRDVPGGPEAIAAATQTVVDALSERKRGLTFHQANQLATQATSQAWSHELLASLLRNEPQLRLSRSGHVGLASWDDVRAPSRAELIRQQVEKAGGSVALEPLQALLLETYGRTLERVELASDCARAHLQLRGDSILVPNDEAGDTAAPQLATPFPTKEPQTAPPPPAPSPVQLAETPPTPTTSAPTPTTTQPHPSAPAPPSLTARPSACTEAFVDLTGQVAGIPAEAREHFEELLREPLRSTEELITAARAHLADIEEEAHHNEFIDLALARSLVERMDRLTTRAATLSTTTRRIVQAAVLYFISNDDAENDFDLGGLDDDNHVLQAVLSHLELDET